MTNENKTRPSSQDIVDFVANLPVDQQPDAEKLIEIMQEVSGEQPVLWGSRIVGFGTYHYVSKSGREGDWMRIGFAPRAGGKLSLYLTLDASELTSKVSDLGKFTIGKGCVYINKLADVDEAKLRELVKIAYATDAMVV